MNLTHMALTAAHKRLMLYKTAAKDARECGFEIPVENYWEPDDDSALALLERAIAAQPGAPRPLFADMVAQETEDRAASLQMMVDMMADTVDEQAS